MPKSGTEALKAAYAVKTPEDSVQLYRDWATTYDQDFAEPMGYVCPREVARVFHEQAGPADTPVLDIGAGTGLLAAELGALADGTVIDAIDISAEMLEVAGAKGLYRDRITADLTGRLDIPGGTYGAMMSSGTFTHGHVGPDALAGLLRIARPGALFCLSINPRVFDENGFGSAFALLVAAGTITPLDFREVPTYEGADHENAKDRNLVAVFRKR